MMNGVTATPECFEAFEQMKMRKSDRFIIYKLSEDEHRIEVDQRGGRDGSFDTFVASLPADECRYAVLAITVTTKVISAPRLEPTPPLSPSDPTRPLRRSRAPLTHTG